ncbi:hypothetical protein N4P66_10635, partial [Riemerella anatipestifer]|nr:hypothetical protein [Riemerella anatipestifer]
RNQSNEYPLKIINEVDRVEKILINNPYIGRVTDVKDIRFFPILRKFLLYYQVTENIIHILAFINADTNERL